MPEVVAEVTVSGADSLQATRSAAGPEFWLNPTASSAEYTPGAALKLSLKAGGMNWNGNDFAILSAQGAHDGVLSRPAADDDDPRHWNRLHNTFRKRSTLKRSR